MSSSNKMKVITDPKLYEEYYFKFSSDPAEYSYKKMLNDHYAPDQYIGFLDRSSSSFVPLVRKDGVVSFYGGFFYNENNFLPPFLSDYIINFLIKNNYIFKLLSINNDCFNFLSPEFKKYDVPYNHNWNIPNLFDFNFTDHQEKIKNISKKKYDRLRRSVKKQDTYYLEEISPSNRKKIKESVSLINTSFKDRGKFFDWQEKIKLLFSILDFFAKDKRLLFFTMHNTSQKNVGWFCVIKKKKTFQNILFNVINRTYENDVIILFLKMLDVLRKNNCEHFDFMSGNFGYKNICGCNYNPLFALVNDPKWRCEYNKDVDKNKIFSIIKRDYGCFLHK